MDTLMNAAAPDLIEPVVGFRDWRVTEEGLCSPRTGCLWPDRVLHATCVPQRVEDLLLAPHAAPHPSCGCGIHASHAFDSRISTIDYRGVSGIVTLWGRLEVDDKEVRAEHARVECLGIYRRWTRRQKNAVHLIAQEIGCDVVDLAALPELATFYAHPVPEVLRTPCSQASAVHGRTLMVEA